MTMHLPTMPRRADADFLFQLFETLQSKLTSPKILTALLPHTYTSPLWYAQLNFLTNITRIELKIHVGIASIVDLFGPHRWNIIWHSLLQSATNLSDLTLWLDTFPLMLARFYDQTGGLEYIFSVICAGKLATIKMSTFESGTPGRLPPVASFSAPHFLTVHQDTIKSMRVEGIVLQDRQNSVIQTTKDAINAAIANPTFDDFQLRIPALRRTKHGRLCHAAKMSSPGACTCDTFYTNDVTGPVTNEDFQRLATSLLVKPETVKNNNGETVTTGWEFGTFVMRQKAESA